MKMLGFLAVAALFATDIQAQERGAERGRQGNQAGGQNQAWDLLRGKYDKDKDGKITLEEYPREDAKFKSFDRDGDGVLSAKDFESGGGRGNRGNRQRGNRGNRGNRAQMMERFAISMLIVPADADKDGQVTTKEWKANLAGLTTEDGGVDVTKLSKNMPAMGRRGGRQRGGQGGNQGGGQGQNQDRMAQQRVRMVTRVFDTDQDGAVTLAELGTWFTKIDKNSDGVLDKSEMPQQQGRQAGGQAPQAGQVAPDFELPWLADKKKTVRLSSFQGKKPVALIFGSYT